MVMISLGLEAIDKEHLEAAETMGADRRKVFTTIIFPMVLPYMFAGYAFVFVISMNEYIISFFLGQSGDNHVAGSDLGQSQNGLLADHRIGGGDLYSARRGRLLAGRPL